MKKVGKSVLILMVLVFSFSSVALFAGGKKEKTLKGPITVGSKEFTEELLLGKITILSLKDAGFSVVDKTGLGGTKISREALLKNEIDMYWEYTGTALLTFLGHEKAITDPEVCYKTVKKEDAKNGIVWLQMAPLNDTYTLMMTQKEGKEKGIKTISDLASYVNSHPNELKLGTDHEFYARPDGIKGLQKVYGFEFPESKVITLDWGLVYKALKDGQVDVAMGFATDGRVGAYNLFNLVDDKKFFPVYNPAPNVRKEIMDKYPEISKILGKIASKLDNSTMISLNKKVDVDEQPVEKVAMDWLKTEGLIK